MCSTPRNSASVVKVRRLSTSTSRIHSDLQMMRKASDMYERRLEERAKRREKLADEKINEDSDSNLTKQSNSMPGLFKQGINYILRLIKIKISPVTSN